MTLRRIDIEVQVTRLNVKVIMTHKQTIISSAIAINAFNIKASYFIFQRRWKEEASFRTLGEKVKGQPSYDFILTYLGQSVFLLCTQINDDDRKTPRKF